MDKYELAVIVDANVSQEEKENIVKEVGDSVAKSGGKIINSQVWLDKHRLAFRMKKKNEGTYYLMNFESIRSSVPKINQLLRLNEKILRYLIIKVE